MKKQSKFGAREAGLAKLICSMLIFSTIGIAVRGIAFPSGFIAMARGFIGVVVMLALMLVLGRRPSLAQIRENLMYLLLSGAFIGFNWILLFESYRYTTVATATLLYYMAPIFVTLLSPLFLGSKIGASRVLCVLAAFSGMALLSEFWSLDFSQENSYIGILCALGAAVLYAVVTLLNKKMGEISAEDKTLAQLLVAALVVLPYTLFAEEVTVGMFDLTSVLLLLFIGVLHTGIAYSLYFSSISALPADTVAVFSYIDPIGAVLLSVIFLDEKMSPFGILGAVLILVSAFMLDRLPTKEKSNN